MRAGSWPSIVLIYLFGVLGPASLGKVIPMQADFAAHLGTSPQAFGLFVSMLMVPPALFGAVAGGVGDRIGPARMLTLSAVIAALCNLAYFVADDMLQFYVLRLIEGTGLVGVFTSAPALLMATTSGQRRTRAMSLWTTYTPVGFSLGLAMVVPFAGGAHWKVAYALHAGLFALAALGGLWLPKVAPPPVVVQAGSRLSSLLDTYRQPGPLRLALAFGSLVFMGFGISAVFPAHFAQAHGVSIGAASSMLALCNLAMIAGSFLTGALRVRGMRSSQLMQACAVAGVVASLLIFAPGVPTAASVAGLCLWLLCSGAAMAVLLTLLPEVVDHPSRGAAAAGLLSQISAIVTFITPPIWLPIQAHGQWWPLCLFVLGASLLSVLLIPPGRPAAGSAAAAAS